MGGPPIAEGEEGPKPQLAGSSWPTSTCIPNIRLSALVFTSRRIQFKPGTGTVRPFNWSTSSCRVVGSDIAPPSAPRPMTASVLTVAICPPVPRLRQSRLTRSSAWDCSVVKAESMAGTARIAPIKSPAVAARGVSGPGPAGTVGADPLAPGEAVAGVVAAPGAAIGTDPNWICESASRKLAGANCCCTCWCSIACISGSRCKV